MFECNILKEQQTNLTKMVGVFTDKEYALQAFKQSESLKRIAFNNDRGERMMFKRTLLGCKQVKSLFKIHQLWPRR